VSPARARRDEAGGFADEQWWPRSRHETASPPERRGARGTEQRPFLRKHLRIAAELIERIRVGGESALRDLTERLGERVPGDPLVLERPVLRKALDSLEREDRDRLERVAGRIASFAGAQRTALSDITVSIPGGARFTSPCRWNATGCYVPGGRHPLPSSALMTTIPARAAGVREIWVATPRPHPVTLAAAALSSDVDGVVVAGGAHAIAALALGAGPVPAVDVVAGPGNVYVTAAKQLLAGRVGIDMMAGALGARYPGGPERRSGACRRRSPGPGRARCARAAGIGDDATRRWWSRSKPSWLGRSRLLPTEDIARAALANGGALVVPNIDQACRVVDRLAPEHLELLVRDAPLIAGRIRNCGAIFVGAGEVLGDYGAGPNHTLPTSRAARFTGGLSVFTFLRIRSWMTIDDAATARGLAEDAVWFARIEAWKRTPGPPVSESRHKPERKWKTSPSGLPDDAVPGPGRGHDTHRGRLSCRRRLVHGAAPRAGHCRAPGRYWLGKDRGVDQRTHGG
jgi:phosphoribosyl-ATP pyrophosphohydrolase/phosphoribosyl-AMP cyclohydrolase/histidinol dehydrogenase